MCTAISVKSTDHYFGRNLDYHFDFGEKIAVTPRNYRFDFTNGKVCDKHYALIGSAVVCDGYPLYFDATNEMGLGIAGLNFPGYAHYNENIKNKDNIASFEFIPYILASCESVQDAEDVLQNVNITNIAFNEKMPPTPLHWLIADRERAITVEQINTGIQVYQNNLGVLTNSPPFDVQMLNLSKYAALSPEWKNDGFLSSTDLSSCGKGTGASGLPGDSSSMSRFVRASFGKTLCEYGNTEEEKVSSFFHILNSVYHIRGCVRDKGEVQMTQYSSCCNATRGIYYYTTYYNSEINAVDMRKENLDSDQVTTYDFEKKTKINITN